MTSALFSDMEGTLTTGSAPRLFVQVGAKLGIFSRWEIMQVVAVNLLGKVLAKSSPWRTKLYYFALFRLIKGHTIAEIERINAVAGKELLERVKPGSLARIREHQQAGRPVVVVSAGAHEMVVAFARELGAVRGEGTYLEQKNGIYTGKGGEVCQGTGKAQRVREIAAELGYNLADSYGYGDTLPDVEFLALLGHPAVIDPDSALEAEARKREWPVLQSDVPVPVDVK